MRPEQQPLPLSWWQDAIWPELLRLTRSKRKSRRIMRLISGIRAMRGFDLAYAMDRTHEPYARLYDSALEHPKFRQVGALGWAFYWKCVNYARRNIKVNVTDGFVPMHVFVNFFEDVSASEARKVGVRMVKAKLLESHRGGFLVHDWLDHQNTKAELEHLSRVGRENVNKREDRRGNPTDGTTNSKSRPTDGRSDRSTKPTTPSLSLSHSLSVTSGEAQQGEVDTGRDERPEVLAAKQWSRDRMKDQKFGGPR